MSINQINQIINKYIHIDDVIKKENDYSSTFYYLTEGSFRYYFRNLYGWGNSDDDSDSDDDNDDENEVDIDEKNYTNDKYKHNLNSLFRSINVLNDVIDNFKLTLESFNKMSKTLKNVYDKKLQIKKPYRHCKNCKEEFKNFNFHHCDDCIEKYCNCQTIGNCVYCEYDKKKFNTGDPFEDQFREHQFRLEITRPNFIN